MSAVTRIPVVDRTRFLRRVTACCVLHAGNIMATTKLMVGIVLLSLLGVLSHWGLGRLERLAIPWRT